MFEKLVLSHLKTIINQLLLTEQAGFQNEILTIDQVTLLIQNVENDYSAKKGLGLLLLTPCGTVA